MSRNQAQLYEHCDCDDHSFYNVIFVSFMLKLKSDLFVLWIQNFRIGNLSRGSLPCVHLKLHKI